VLDADISARSAELQALLQGCRQLEAGECGPYPAAPPADGCIVVAGPPGDRRCPPELKDLNSTMTTADMAREVEELKKDCASYTEKLERIKSATNQVTPEEKEKLKSWGPLGEGGMYSIVHIEAAHSRCLAALPGLAVPGLIADCISPGLFPHGYHRASV